ncbi:hypothetical protein [Catenulispora pinisilvae]|uniref:hypothetical protein n=1 Tax=Catenulispora pinisilvae TaxID=2705253 RepID=UPI001891C488|nr:hypothetical protein [Catenulispora pinisilvae]
MVVDEAHHTTGKADGPWKGGASRRGDPGRTPAVYDRHPAGLDRHRCGGRVDGRPQIFGEVCYRLPFSKPIDLGLLAMGIGPDA